MMRYELTDYEWAAIRPMLPNKAPCRGSAATAKGPFLLFCMRPQVAQRPPTAGLA